VKLLTSVRLAIGVLVVALIGGAVAYLQSSPATAIALFAVAALFTSAVVVIAIVSHAVFKSRAEQLGVFLRQGYDLAERKVADDGEYEQWVRDYARWCVDTTHYVASNVSKADSALFDNLTGMRNTH